MKNILTEIGVGLFAMAIVLFIALAALHHSGAIDPHKLHRAVTGKMQYPDNLFGGHGR